MKHNLKISVSKKPQESSIVRCRTVSIRERVLRYLLGKKQRLTLIVPGDTVECVSISELPEDGDDGG